MTDASVPRAAPTTSPPYEADSRHATILALDTVRSTVLAREIGAERGYEMLRAVRDITRDAVEAHGGHVVDEAGDGLMAAFGAHRGVEGAALLACRAALRARERIKAAFEGEDRAPAIRIGIATGTVMVARRGESIEVIGDPVVLAARLEAACEPGEILVAPATQRETQQDVRTARRGDSMLKSFDGPVALHALVGLRDRFDRLGARSTAPFTGRGEELSRAQALFATAERGATLVVEGPPGIGKSRLLSELSGALPSPRTLLVGRCESGGLASDFEPIMDVLRQATDADDGVRRAELLWRAAQSEPAPGDGEAIERFVAVVPHSDPTRHADSNTAFLADLVRRVAERQDALVAIEDVHWIDGPSRAVLREIARMPIDIAATTRSRQAADALDRDGALVMSLRPLGDEEIGRIVANTLDAPAGPDLQRFVVARAEGVPFMAEEVARALQEGDHLELVDGVLRLRDAVEAVVTGNVQQMVLARVDRLSETLRKVLRIASLVGREIDASLIETILAHPVDLRPAAASGLVEHVGGDRWRFAHALVRDSLAQSVVDSQARRIHGLIYAALSAASASAARETAGRLARHALAAGLEADGAAHLLRAAQHRLASYALEAVREDCERLGWMIVQSPDLLDVGQKRSLAATWTRTLDLLGRYTELQRVATEMAVHLGDETSPERTLVRTLSSLALCHLRDYEGALRLARESLAEANDAGDAHGAAWARVALMRIFDETGWAPTDEIVALAREAVRTGEEMDDPHLEMSAHYLNSSALRSAGRRREALSAVERLDTIRQRTGDRRASAYAAWARALIYAIEDDPQMARAAVAPALERAIPGSGDERVGRGIDLFARAMLLEPDPLRGPVEDLAREGYEVGDLNIAHSLEWTAIVLELRAGRLATAWRALRRLEPVLEEAGNENLLRQALMLRGEMLLAIGGLPAPGRTATRGRPRAIDVLAYLRLRPRARQAGARALERCLALDRSGRGSHAARCELGLARVSAARKRTNEALDHAHRGREAAASEGLQRLEAQAEDMIEALSSPSSAEKLPSW